ncbi:helix-turn-helix transcriptional regulator [Streptomyces diastatochromogenes]|nr:helix-turn-helix transcriptional regulator [Streptomyces diastatochromogenes]
MYGKKSFGTVLRGLRQRGRLTMEELAEASGVSVRAIGDMERGRSLVPQRRTVVALAEGLGLGDDEREALLATARAARPTRAVAVAGTVVPPRTVGTSRGGRRSWRSCGRPPNGPRRAGRRRCGSSRDLPAAGRRRWR